MRPGRLFFCRLVLMAEADSNSDWSRTLASLGCPCWPPKVVAKEEDVQGHLLGVLHLLGACSIFGQGPKGEYLAHDDDVVPGRNSDRMS